MNKAIDSKGMPLVVGDTVRVHERYDDWLGIIKEIHESVAVPGKYMIAVQPFSPSTPHYIMSDTLTRVDSLEAEQ